MFRIKVLQSQRELSPGLLEKLQPLKVKILILIQHFSITQEIKV